MNLTLPAPPRPVVLLTGGGLLLTALATPKLVGFVSTRPYGEAAPLIVLPLLVAVSVPIIRKVAAGPEERQLLWVLWAGLGLKFLGSLYRYYAAFELYGGYADADVYHGIGAQIAVALRSLDPGPIISAEGGTAMLRVVTGVVYAVIGVSRPGGFVAFAWLAFLGQLAFLHAFRIAIPDARSVWYAMGVLWLPTMSYWPSSIGKDAWMVLCLGVATLGAVHVLRNGRSVRGWVLTSIGVLGAGSVRPHVAALLVAGFATAVLVRRPRPELGLLGPFAKLVLVGLVSLLALFAVTQAERFFEESGVIDEGEGAAAVLDVTARRTTAGSSTFEPTIVRSPLDLPVATFTVLFRPHPLEAHNLQALLVALEGAGLAAVSLLGLRRVSTSWRRWRTQPLVLAASVYTLLFIVGFSSVGNFGILARQRSQLLPFFLVLLVVPAIRRGAELDPIHQNGAPA